MHVRAAFYCVYLFCPCFLLCFLQASHGHGSIDRGKRTNPCPIKIDQVLEPSYTFMLEGGVTCNQQSALATSCYIHVVGGRYDTLWPHGSYQIQGWSRWDDGKRLHTSYSGCAWRTWNPTMSPATWHPSCKSGLCCCLWRPGFVVAIFYAIMGAMIGI